MNLQREILEVLRDVSGHLMTTASVHAQVKCSTGEDKTLTDVASELRGLERKGPAPALDPDDFGHRWAITDAGKMRLAD